MPTITISHNLPFVTVQLQANHRSLTMEHVLLDTGSAASIFKTEILEQLDVRLEPHDPIHYMSGIGGREIVVEKQIDSLMIGNLIAQRFTIQMGALDYGISMNGILGLDFLRLTGAQIDFATLTIQ